jgi:hypothetical protein
VTSAAISASVRATAKVVTAVRWVFQSLLITQAPPPAHWQARPMLQKRNAIRRTNRVSATVTLTYLGSGINTYFYLPNVTPILQLFLRRRKS